MKGGEKGKRQRGQELPVEDGSDTIPATISAADSADDRRGQLERIGEIEKRLWTGADTLRANSNFASNEYFLPVMGLIFLRHAYSRFLSVKAEIEAGLPTRGGKKRELQKEDFSRKGAIFLRKEAQFDYLVSLPEGADRAKAIIDAMSSIEDDYDSLKGTLPKNEYQELDNDVLGRLLRIFNDPALKNANGDIFGRIYEYFLTGFADLKAHDGGEFFTPISLVQMIVNVIEPDHGKVLDPACGSGGMFVQSAHFIEAMKKSPTEQVTFYGMEKNPTTIRLAKMNLAVHGLEGNIDKAITYYEDPHELVGKADFVMANPPFNVDEIDAEKIKRDPRLPYQLPGVNKQGKVSNGNYVWISYFDAYLNPHGRAGFVMSSQASSAGGEEARIRQELIKSRHVEAMIAIRGNFFYTRTVPCELWFLNKVKPEKYRNKVLMIDARTVYRKVTRKIYDFSREQLKNLTSIVWLYRGQSERFLALVAEHLSNAVAEAERADVPLISFTQEAEAGIEKISRFFKTTDDERGKAAFTELTEANYLLSNGAAKFIIHCERISERWATSARSNEAMKAEAAEIGKLAEESHDLIRQIDQVAKHFSGAVTLAEKELGAKENGIWSNKEVKAAVKAIEEARKMAAEQLKLIRYFHRHAHWLQERFPGAKLRDVEGLVKVVSHDDLEARDWSLTPGRYVGIAPEEEDEDFDFEETLREIHLELADLNAEASELAAKIAKNFEGLGI
jgi:type I restriction enzyme M protein